MADSQPAVSIGRLLKVVVPIAILALIAYGWSRTLEKTARQKSSDNVFAKILSSQPVAVDESSEKAVEKADSKKPAAASKPNFVDKDGDLVADSPDDPAQCIKPEVLVFSYIAGDTDSVPEASWKELLAALKAKTKHEVKFVHYDTMAAQLEALNKGELHIAGLNTGAVPSAVEQAGFVPLCTFGHDDGTYGIKMQVLVPADSPIKTLADVKGHKIMFTRADSNSGCKALLMKLKDDGLQPDRDYTWGFSSSHEESIKGIATKQYEVAPVASDLLQRMEKNGDVDEKLVRVIYESERFPPGTLGYAYNLSPELRTAIREALKDFSLKGTGLDGKMGEGVTKLVPVDYKKDWESTRRIDQLAAQARAKRDG